MNNKLNQAMDHISDRHLSEAATPVRRRYYPYLGAIAAVLALVLIASFLFTPLGQLFAPTPTTTGPILQNPTHSCHPNTSFIPTTKPTYPNTTPSTQPSTIPNTQPSIPSSSIPTGSTVSTQPSSMQIPTTVTRPTVGDPCAEGHCYAKRLNGRCVVCYAKDPDYDPCADGHNFQDYYCTDCGYRHSCADGHSYEDGICTWCWAPDPAVAVRATVTLDKAMYTTNEPVCFTISPSGTTYELIIIRCSFSFADEPWERHYKDVGTFYTLSFDQPGRYQVAVVPNSNLDTIWQSSMTTFAIVDPCTSSGGHTFDRGFCTICRAKDYLYDFCGAGGCTSYIHGYCRYCGSVFPTCAAGHTYSKQTGHCIHCGATHPACYNGHPYKDGFCINCGVFDPNTDPCVNGHTFQDGVCIYCDTVDPCAKGHTFEDGCCCVCGIPIACYHGMHSYENGFCKHCQNQELFDEDAKLIVNGKDITTGNYVKINMRDSNRYSNASIPLTAVLTELGIPWEWESDTVLRFGSGDSIQIIDLALDAYNFPIPPGATGAVRKVVGDEVIVDLRSLWANLLSNQGIPFEIDCATKTIRIGTTA